MIWTWTERVKRSTSIQNRCVYKLVSKAARIRMHVNATRTIDTGTYEMSESVYKDSQKDEHSMCICIDVIGIHGQKQL